VALLHAGTNMGTVWCLKTVVHSLKNEILQSERIQSVHLFTCVRTTTLREVRVSNIESRLASCISRMPAGSLISATDLLDAASRQRDAATLRRASVVPSMGPRAAHALLSVVVEPNVKSQAPTSSTKARQFER